MEAHVEMLHVEIAAQRGERHSVQQACSVHDGIEEAHVRACCALRGVPVLLPWQGLAVGGDARHDDVGDAAGQRLQLRRALPVPVVRQSTPASHGRVRKHGGSSVLRWCQGEGLGVVA